MKIKVELELTPEEAKELYVPISSIPIMTEVADQFQKQWFEQMQQGLKLMRMNQ